MRAFRHPLGKIAVLLAFATVLILPAGVSTNATALPTNTPLNQTNPTKRSALPTNTPAEVIPPTSAELPTLVPTQPPPATETPSPLPSPTVRPSRTPRPTQTPTPTRTPSRTPMPPPTLVIEGTYVTPIFTPQTAIPPSAATPVVTDDVTTILLLGSDTITAKSTSRTDVMILLAINRTTNTVTLMHIPRDLLVYVPNFTMEKLNTVVSAGNKALGAGKGIQVMKDALRYNLGVTVNFYARVDFVTFQTIISKLGGLEITVDCGIEDWKLKTPDLDITLPENYEPYSLFIGKHTLDPYTALWYVRSRVTSTDLDRGRRQIEVLRAMWRQARAQGIFGQVVQLWPEAQQIVDTDMTLQDIAGLIPVALAVSPEAIQRVSLAQGLHFEPWYTSGEGQFVFLPKADAMRQAVQNFYLPPSQNRLGGEAPRVEIAAYAGITGLGETITDRLSWDGFAVTLLPSEGLAKREATVIYDYTGGSSPNSLKAIMKSLRVGAGAVIAKPDPNRTVDFRVELGSDYGSSCFYSLPKDSNPTTPQP